MSYEVDTSRISRREDGYTDFWRREPDLILHQTDEAVPHVDVYRFPPVENSPEEDYYVYVSGGMSDLVQPGTDSYDVTYQRVEVSLFSKERIMTNSGKTDFLGWICGWMAHYPFNQKTYFAAGQTFDWGRPLVDGSAMHGFYFAHLPLHDEDALCAAIGTARSFIHLIPISKAEIDYAKSHGKEKLLTILERFGVPPWFDLKRPSSP
jgi:hypothetical protein